MRGNQILSRQGKGNLQSLVEKSLTFIKKPFVPSFLGFLTLRELKNPEALSVLLLIPVKGS